MPVVIPRNFMQQQTQRERFNENLQLQKHYENLQVFFY
jgi:hypothetical protein